MSYRVRLGVAGLLVSGTIALAGSPAMAAGHHTVVVSPGVGTISAAVAAASPGDTLKLEKGTFHDSVLITKTLTIRGEGDATVIKPPATSTNPCNQPGTMEGLCVAGQLDSSGNPDLSKPVADVHIADLRTTGFSDSGVIGFNTIGLRVTDVRSDHNGGYGIARFASVKSLFADNRTSYNVEAGLYVGDSPEAASAVVDNRTDHNGIGIFLRDSTDVLASGNSSSANCVGVLALNSGQGATGPTGAGKYLIQENNVSANNSACPATEGPPTSGIGIALVGVERTKVLENKVNNNKPGGPTFASGGIVIVSTASNNLVKDNELRGNQPADIFWDQTGTGNKVRENECRTAIPGNLGWCSAD
jgi:nitrous oxidase accessory protein NosD